MFVPFLVTEPAPEITPPKVALLEPLSVKATAFEAAFVNDSVPEAPAIVGKVSAVTAEPKETLPPERAKPPTFNEPLKTKLPAPATVSVELVPVTLPPTVSVFAATVTVLLPERVTGPVPVLRLFVPAKVKLPFQVSALLFAKVSAEPVPTSKVPPLKVTIPRPTAFALPSESVPAESVTPVSALLPVRRSVPVSTFDNVPKPAIVPP